MIDLKKYFKLSEKICTSNFFIIYLKLINIANRFLMVFIEMGERHERVTSVINLYDDVNRTTCLSKLAIVILPHRYSRSVRNYNYDILS